MKAVIIIGVGVNKISRRRYCDEKGRHGRNKVKEEVLAWIRK